MISIITPVYNGEKFIANCIKVVIDQNCNDIEHIILDGGSKDSTVEIIKHYAENYPHIRWISEKDNGQSDAMNKGISMAKGEVLGILNADDYYEPNVLNRVVQIFKDLPQPSLLVGNCNVLDDNQNLLFINRPKKLKLLDLLLGDEANPFPINPAAYFYHTSLHEKAGLYKVEEHYGMDLDFLLRGVQVANLKYIDETLGNFRFIEGSKTFSSTLDNEITSRKKNILNHYRQKLPLFQQWYVLIGYNLYEMKRKLKKLKISLSKVI